MPRPARPENQRNPIRRLRSIVGEALAVDPFSGERFAKLLTISADTVRSMENGRCRITPMIMDRVRRTMGAVLVGGEWRCVANLDFAFTPALCRQLLDAGKPSAGQVRADAAAMSQRVADLLLLVAERKPKAYLPVFSAIVELCESIRVEHFKTDAEAAAVLLRTMPTWVFSGEAGADEPVQRIYPSRPMRQGFIADSALDDPTLPPRKKGPASRRRRRKD